MAQQNIIYLGVEHLHPHPKNPRQSMSQEGLDELSASIKLNSVLQNLTVVPAPEYGEGEYTIIIGHRRHTAAKMAGLLEVPCIVREMDEATQIRKVAHHGSKLSSTSSFIDSVAPSYAVISVGGSNTYGHPAEEVLSRFKDRNLSLYRTDIQGDIHCTSDGSKITFDVEKNSDFDTYLAAGGYKKYLKELEAARATEPPATEAPATKPTTTNPPETKETTVTVTPTEKIAPSTNSDSTSNGSSCNYIANTNTHKFHYPTCSSVKQMNENNKWYYDGSRNDLIAMGYSPCKKCNP